MRKRKIETQFEDLAKSNKILFKEPLKQSKVNVSPPFSEEKLNKVLKNYIFELFKDRVIEDYLRQSVLMMFNKMKHDMKIPKNLQQVLQV